MLVMENPKTNEKKKTGLRVMREAMEPKVTQEMVARRADITLNAYQKIETGKNVRFSTVQKILKGFNEIRREHGLEDVDMWALGLNIT